MRKNPDIKQVSTKGSEGIQIGVQNINIGMTPQAASEMATNLFMENFPKLQEEARKAAQERADELCRDIINRLKTEGVKDYSAFKDPDVQYVLLEAQKNYARFGTSEMLEILSGLICKRVQEDKDLMLKVAIDKAIEIAPMITSEQLDLLSLLFFCKCAIYSNISTLSQLVEHYSVIAEQYKNADFDSIEYLLMHGCLTLKLGSAGKMYSEKLGLSENKINEACPQIIQRARGDYAPSYIGIVLAIINSEMKCGEKLDPHIWIK